MKLSEQKCVPCEGGTLPMNLEDIARHLQELSGWELKEKKLYKEFVFKDFVVAMRFVNVVAEVAEQEGHHPDIRIFSYKKVALTLWTHAIGGLSINDFILAAKIDEIHRS